jgi:magnesium-transporting ATPase (P-type)
VLASFGVSPGRLKADEVATRRVRFGANLLPRCPKRPWYLKLAANLFHLLALLLWAAAALSWILGTLEVAVAIIAVIAINGMFSFLWRMFFRVCCPP